MKISRFIAAALAAALVAGTCIAGTLPDASGQESKTVIRAGRKSAARGAKLQEENARLKETIDSLRQELETCRAEMRMTDSLTSEMIRDRKSVV